MRACPDTANGARRYGTWPPRTIRNNIVRSGRERSPGRQSGPCGEVSERRRTRRAPRTPPARAGPSAAPESSQRPACQATCGPYTGPRRPPTHRSARRGASGEFRGAGGRATRPAPRGPRWCRDGRCAVSPRTGPGQNSPTLRSRRGALKSPTHPRSSPSRQLTACGRGLRRCPSARAKCRGLGATGDTRPRRARSVRAPRNSPRSVRGCATRTGRLRCRRNPAASS